MCTPYIVYIGRKTHHVQIRFFENLVCAVWIFILQYQHDRVFCHLYSVHCKLSVIKQCYEIIYISLMDSLHSQYLNYFPLLFIHLNLKGLERLHKKYFLQVKNGLCTAKPMVSVKLDYCILLESILKLKH